MSLGTDVITEIDIEVQARYKEIEHEAMRGFWITKDGKRIHVSDMTDSHIKNTINFIKKVDKVDLYLPWIHRFERELKEDIVSILHVFSCRLYGLRKYKKQIKEDEEIAKELQDGNKSNIGTKD